MLKAVRQAEKTVGVIMHRKVMRSKAWALGGFFLPRVHFYEVREMSRPRRGDLWDRRKTTWAHNVLETNKQNVFYGQRNDPLRLMVLIDPRRWGWGLGSITRPSLTALAGAVSRRWWRQRLINGRSWRSFLKSNRTLSRETERKGTGEHKYWQLFRCS